MPTRIHLGNLPDNCSKDSIRDLFGPYGEITDLTVIKNYGFVSFVKKEDAEKAIEDLNKSKMFGKEISVEFAKQKQQRYGESSQDNRKNRNIRRDDNRRSSNQRNSNGNQAMNLQNNLLNPLGGILGSNPGAALPALGLLNTLNAAVAGQLEQNQHNDLSRPPPPPPPPSKPKEQPDPDVRVRREVVHVRDVPQAASLGINSGYVIHERYYVDSSHPLLRGIPLTKLPRLSDPPKRYSDTPKLTQNNSYTSGDEYAGASPKYNEPTVDRRERSPVRNRDIDYLRY